MLEDLDGRIQVLLEEWLPDLKIDEPVMSAASEAV